MKKVTLLGTILLVLASSIFLAPIFLLLPSSVFATSGACSDHAGVNCNTGSDWDGSVICNDGWRESTVNYAYAEECSDSPRCTQTELNSLYEKYKIDEQTNSINQIKSDAESLITQINNIPNQLKAETQDYAVSAAQLERMIVAKQAPLISEYNAKVSELQSLRTVLKTDLSNLESYCKTLGFKRWFEMQAEALKRQKQTTVQNQTSEADINTTRTVNDASAVCPANSILKGDGLCWCDDGFGLSKLSGKCIKLDVWCSETMPHSSYSNETKICRCDKGYWLNVDENTCEERLLYCQRKFGINSINGDLDCVCKVGFVWNTERSKCVAKNSTDTTAITKLKKIDPHISTRVDTTSTNSVFTTTSLTASSTTTNLTVQQTNSTTGSEQMNRQESAGRSIKSNSQIGNNKKVLDSIVGAFKKLFTKIKFW